MEVIRVNDEFVQLKGAVVLKCKLQSSSLGSPLERAGDLFWPTTTGQLGDAGDGSGPSSSSSSSPSWLTTDSNAPFQGGRGHFSIEWLTSDGLQVSSAEPLAKGKCPNSVPANASR